MRTLDTAAPGSLSAPIAITGLPMGVKIGPIDFRPTATQEQLFGLGSNDQLYFINHTNGVASAVGPPQAFTGNVLRV